MMQPLLGIVGLGFTEQYQQISVHSVFKESIPARNTAGKGNERLLMKLRNNKYVKHYSTQTVD